MVQVRKGSLATRGKVSPTRPNTTIGGDKAPKSSLSDRFNKHKSNKRGA